MSNRSDYMEQQFGREYKAKIAIAKWAVDNLVSNFKAVLLDTGSTAELVAKELFSKKRYLSILTNNVGAYVQYTNPRINESKRVLPNGDSAKSEDIKEWKKNLGMGLTNGNELLITGGLFNPIHEGLYGQDAIAAIENFHPNISIIGVSGLTYEGLYGRGKHDSEVKQKILKRPAEIRIAITDWTKIGKTDAHSFGTIKNFASFTSKAYIITNTPPTEKQLSKLTGVIKKHSVPKENLKELESRIIRFKETKEKLSGFKFDDTEIKFEEVPFQYDDNDLLKNYFGLEL